jgi:hypothetical protein
MSRIKYIDIKFPVKKLEAIQRADDIARNYARQGYNLTLRQLYYQFVARDYLANNQQNYKWLGSVINDARLAGLFDWSYIVDLTRSLESVPHWDTPDSIISSAAYSYRIDKWQDQRYRVEVWVEKQALEGVVSRAARAEDVSYFSCRGYNSQSNAHEAAQRLQKYIDDGQEPVVIHLGDHDPSGIDMTGDIRKRFGIFIGTGQIKVVRIALNMGQIERFNPPPNPAKLTDSRAKRYIAKFGRESWELDALSPATLDNLIRRKIRSFRDEDLYTTYAQREVEERAYLSQVSSNWEEIAEHIDGEYGTPDATLPPDTFEIDDDEAEYDEDNEESVYDGTELDDYDDDDY